VESVIISRMEAMSEQPNDKPSGEVCTLELKICERCGGLWLRPAGSGYIYCGPCKVKVDDLPPVSLQPDRGGKRHSKNARVISRTERVQ
jgi:hypothetical protein